MVYILHIIFAIYWIISITVQVNNKVHLMDPFVLITYLLYFILWFSYLLSIKGLVGSVMNNSNPRKLTKQQLDILQTLYTFRFGTTDLLAVSTNKVSRRVMHKRLQVLCNNDYIQKHDQKQIGIYNQHATYCLKPKGVKALIDIGFGKPQALRNIRNDIRASKRFARHSIGIFETVNALKVQFGNHLHLQTRNDFYGDQDLPEVLPDAYVTVADARGRARHQFLLVYVDETKPRRIWSKQISALLDSAYCGEWDEDDTHPDLLLVCATPILRLVMQKFVDDYDEESGLIDLEALVVMPKAVESSIKFPFH
jgi:hypothetical protein